MPPSPAAQERRRRVAGIRRTVAVLAVSAFLALWSGLFVQLRSGHDPALGATSSASSSSTATTGSSGSTTSSGSSDSSDSSSSSDSASSSDSSDSSGQTDGTTATAPSTSDSLPSATTSQS